MRAIMRFVTAITAAKITASSSLTELIDQFVAGLLTGEAVNVVTAAFIDAPLDVVSLPVSVGCDLRSRHIGTRRLS